MRHTSPPLSWSQFLIIAWNILSMLPSLLYASDFQSPRTAGLGGAGHAGPLLNDAIYLNPSFTSFNPYRGFSGNYLSYGSEGVNSAGQSTTRGMNYNFSILDGSQDSLFQAGVGFTKRGDASMVHVGASKSVINRLGFGLGTKIILPAGTNNRLFDGTLSVSGLATQWFQTTLMVDNLLEANAAHGFYREFTLGTKFNILSIVSIYFDPHWVPTLPGGQDWGYEMALEFTVLSDFYLRMGSFKNSMIPFEAARGNGYGLGLGWLGPKLSIDYGLTRAQSPFALLAHQIGMTIFF